MCKLTFINHASYILESNSSVLLVDPWVEGGAFDNGWSLLDSSITNQMLVDYLTGTDKAIFIWLSHEHPDHFSIPFIKKLKENKVEAKFFFQKTLDGRIAQFIRKFGFSITESNDKLEVLDQELSIITFPYSGGDSCALMMLNELSILNINDCIVQDNIGVEHIIRHYKKYTNNIDLLLTQFGYANWVGNPNEVEVRRKSAKEKIDRILLQIRRFEPKAVIPFASFAYFSDKDNFHTNDSQNTPKDVSSLFESNRLSNELIVLKPWDTLDLNKTLKQESTIRKKNILHWETLFHAITPNYIDDKKLSIEEIKEAYKFFARKNFKHYLFAPRLFEIFKKIHPVEFYIYDLDLNVILSYREGLRIENGCKEKCDISLSAATLKFTLMHEYGANTTHVNGKFERVSEDGVEFFSTFFTPQEYMKMGYGLTNPFASLKLLTIALGRRLLNKK